MRQKIKRTKLATLAGINLVKLALNPRNTQNALRVSDKLLALGLFKHGVAHLRANPLTANLVDNPHTIESFDLDRLIQLPVGTLGHELASDMKKAGLDPNYFRRDNPEVEGKVILDHIEQTHDIWHIVTGFDISVAGEVGILAFQFGQLRAPQSAAFIGGAFLRALMRDLNTLPPVMDAIAKGWALAHKWPPLFAVDWNEIMDMPVAQIRERLDQGVLPHSSNGKT